MNGFFDIYTILFLVLAIVLFLRLRNVLGRRTGNERPPFDPYSRRDTAKADDQTGDTPAPAKVDGDNVVTLPGQTRAAPVRPAPDWSAYFVPGSDSRDGLQAIAAADRNFDPGSFVAGARSAYEMIVTAFAEGDRKTLRSLLSREVYDGFAGAIAERETAGQKVEMTFVGIDEALIADAGMKGRQAQVTLQIRSKLISVTKDADGKVVDGDPAAIADVTDVWTFARDTGSRDPNWNLVATEAGD
ncbi:MAG: Tim44 domain-containing protein [Rhodobiaceae bacterium]|nr:Tim44 domain-containing protein [Rhodobiaceae bacterium]MCC0055435.1 Tim44 domain-containing protein [Rhodobiaceae bacterium]